VVSSFLGEKGRNFPRKDQQAVVLRSDSGFLSENRLPAKMVPLACLLESEIQCEVKFNYVPNMAQETVRRVHEALNA
jgi:hypothetical protein